MLKDIVIRHAKPQEKLYRLFDSGGLYLEISPSGGKYWRYKYRFAGKERRLAFGIYPDLSLADARELHAKARKALAMGNDPSDEKREAKRIAILNRENSFEAIAREMIEKRRSKWSKSYGDAMLRRMKSDLFPKLGHRPITGLAAVDFISALRIVEKRGAHDLILRLLQAAGQTFRYAIATGRAEKNPIPDLRGAFTLPNRKHQAYLKERELPEFLNKLFDYDGDPRTKLAVQFLLLTFVRTGELRGGKKDEIDWKNAEWRIPPERMKMKELHVVPLSAQAMQILRQMQDLTSDSLFLFPNQHKPTGCMSENTILYALYRMGYHSKATGHGFRATASTILNENGFSPDVIERQLAHGERNEVRAAYNHAQYLPQRREMMQWWADYLDRAAAQN